MPAPYRVCEQVRSQASQAERSACCLTRTSRSSSSSLSSLSIRPYLTVDQSEFLSPHLLISLSSYSLSTLQKVQRSMRECRANLVPSLLSWMEGLVLMMLYLIIAVSFWYYPVSRCRWTWICIIPTGSEDIKEKEIMRSVLMCEGIKHRYLARMLAISRWRIDEEGRCAPS